MKLRNMVKKFSCGLLAVTMVLSLAACGSKESDDDDDDKGEEAKVEKTVSELVEDMNSQAALSTDMIEKALEDECLTYEEFEEMLKTIPSSKMEGTFDFDISLKAEIEEEKESQDIVCNCTYLIEYDSNNMGLHLNMDIEVMDEVISMESWIINEDGTYYSYDRTSDDDTTYRTEIGNIKEAFGEGITKEDFDYMINELELDSYTELFDYSEMLTDSQMKEFEEMFTLAKDYIEHAGKEYYNLVMNFDAGEFINSIKDNEEVKKLLEAFGIENIDEILSLELEYGLTVQDFIDITKFDINYYIDPTDLFVAHIDCDYKDFLNDILGLLEEVMVKSYEEMEYDIEVDFVCNSASLTYDFDNDADVTVKYDGEFEDYSDYYDEMYDYNESIIEVPTITENEEYLVPVQ